MLPESSEPNPSSCRIRLCQWCQSKRAGLEFPNDNECDGFWLWVAANYQVGQPLYDLPAINRESLKKIKMEG